MNCSECNAYNRGKGKKECLKCKQYLEIIKKSGLRSSIPIEVVPSIILEALPDQSGTNLLQIVKQLPLDFSVPLLMKYCLMASEREIAKHLKMSKTKVHNKIIIALDIIKKTPIIDQ